jgi:hypothetical protein
VALLLEDYAHFVARARALAAKLELLRNLHGAERIAQWQEHLPRGPVAAAGAPPPAKAITTPAYTARSCATTAMPRPASRCPFRDISPEGFPERVARALTREHGLKPAKLPQ